MSPLDSALDSALDFDPVKAGAPNFTRQKPSYLQGGYTWLQEVKTAQRDAIKIESEVGMSVIMEADRKFLQYMQEELISEEQLYAFTVRGHGSPAALYIMKVFLRDEMAKTVEGLEKGTAMVYDHLLQLDPQKNMEIFSALTSSEHSRVVENIRHRYKREIVYIAS